MFFSLGQSWYITWGFVASPSKNISWLLKNWAMLTPCGQLTGLPPICISLLTLRSFWRFNPEIFNRKSVTLWDPLFCFNKRKMISILLLTIRASMTYKVLDTTGSICTLAQFNKLWGWISYSMLLMGLSTVSLEGSVACKTFKTPCLIHSLRAGYVRKGFVLLNYWKSSSHPLTVDKLNALK